MKKILSLMTGLLFAACALKAQQGPPPQQPPSPEAHIKQVTGKLEKDLSLTAAQKQKVTDAYKTFFAGMKKLFGNQPPPPPPPPPGKKEEVDKLAKMRDENIKKALTAEQFKKYQEIEKSMRPPRPGGQGGPDGPPPGQ